MKEKLRIKKLFEDLFDGDPWLDVTLMGTLGSIGAEQAAKKQANLPNSIWEIVHHVIHWRQNVLQRVQGQVIETPPDNYFRPIADPSLANWQHCIAELGRSQEHWLQFLEEMDEAQFDTPYAANNKTNYEHIHGIIQHDAYHLGQIVLMAKHF
jgi:uncharacterized damage-inducible protein DinB